MGICVTPGRNDEVFEITALACSGGRFSFEVGNVALKVVTFPSRGCELRKKAIVFFLDDLHLLQERLVGCLKLTQCGVCRVRVS